MVQRVVLRGEGGEHRVRTQGACTVERGVCVCGGGGGSCLLQLHLMKGLLEALGVLHVVLVMHELAGRRS